MNKNFHYFYCKIHPNTHLHTLHFWLARGPPISMDKFRDSKKHKAKFKIRNNKIQFLYCQKCDDIYKVSIKLTKVRKKITNFYQILGKNRLKKEKIVRDFVRTEKKKFKEEQKKLGKRAGRPYSPKPLPMKITALRDGWYFSREKTRFHYIKNNRFYCRPSYKINLDMIPVRHTIKLQGKMCQFCKRKRGIRSFKQNENWESWNKHYEAKLLYDRKRYEAKKQAETKENRQERLKRSREKYAKAKLKVMAV